MKRGVLYQIQIVIQSQYIYFFLSFENIKIAYAHQGFIYLIKNTAKTVITTIF